MGKRSLFLLILSLLYYIFSCNPAISQDIPVRPVPPRLVNDFAGLLKNDEIDRLEQKLIAFSDSTTTQIAIVVVTSLEGYDKADYAQRLAEKWGIGQKGLDNGVLILVKTKTADSNGEVFIAPGYGLEGVIPDIICGEIVDNDLLPAFRAGEYFRGLDYATNTLISLASGEFSAADYGRSAKKSSGKDGSGVFFIIVLFMIIFFISRRGGRNNKNISSSGLPLWLLLGMMNSGRGSHRGSWGGFSGRGGGFGGFGGGSFGGGGAGGSW